MKKIIILSLICYLAILSANDKVLVWSGKILSGKQQSGKTFVVEKQQNLRCFLRYELLNETPGFRMIPTVCFVDNKGKVISNKGMGEIFPDPKDSKYLDAEIYVKAPSKAVKAYFSLNFYGNSGSIKIKEETIQVSANPVKEKMRYKPMANPIKLNDKQLDEHLSKRSIANAKIVRKGQYNTIAINGKEITPAIYLTTGYKTPLRYSMLNSYAQAGVKIVSCSAILGVGRPNKSLAAIWQGEGKYNIKVLQLELRRILKEFPDAYILLNLDVSPYRNYLKENPNEAYCDYDGNFVGFHHGYARKTSKKLFISPVGVDGLHSLPSYYSTHYANAAAKAIEDICNLVSQLPEGKAVMAVYLNGGTDGQWYDQFDGKLKIASDNSPAAQKAFKLFVKQKYQNNLTQLRKAWRDDKANFDTIKVPNYNELWNKEKSFHTIYQESSRLSDYCEFLGTAFAKRHILWCKAVKKGSQNRFLAGSYYNNSGLRGYPQLGHQSVNVLLKAPEVELLATVPSYQRNLREPVHQGGFSGSLVRHGKLQITELDLRTGELPYWGRWGMPFWRNHNPADRFAKDAARFAASAISKGGSFHIYDMEGGVFNSQKAKAAWQQAIALLNNRTPLPFDNNHIGVISSEKFWNYQSFGKDRIAAYTVRETPLHALYRSGVKHMEYVLEDIFSKDFIAPKVMIFLDTGTLTIKQANEIRQRYGKDGRVICFLGTPGIFTTNGQEKISQLTNFKLKRNPSVDNRPLVAKESSKSPLLKDVKGFLIPYTPEYGHQWGKAYEVIDSKAEIIATYYKSNVPGGAVKYHPNYTEIYLGSYGSITPQLCRNMAKLAKVHVYSNSNDFSDINAGLLSISALSTGKKSIFLPKNVTNVQSLTGQKVNFSQNKVLLDMKVGELLILKLNYKNK